jgi:hypothetical protein
MVGGHTTRTIMIMRAARRLLRLRDPIRGQDGDQDTGPAQAARDQDMGPVPDRVGSARDREGQGLGAGQEVPEGGDLGQGRAVGTDPVLEAGADLARVREDLEDLEADRVQDRAEAVPVGGREAPGTPKHEVGAGWSWGALKAPHSGSLPSSAPSPGAAPERPS